MSVGINSRGKHFRGHREFAKVCRDHGFTAVHCVNGQLDSRGLPGISLTVRRTERLRLDRAMAEAIAEAGSKLPLLVHRSSRQPWRITMESETFFCLYRAFIQMSPPDPAKPASEPYPCSDQAPVHPLEESAAPSVSEPFPAPIPAHLPQIDNV